ncbi:hypothetical protein OBK05_01560 [Empedobacter falsenii]
MQTINRTKYFLYYLKELDYSKFSKFLNYTCKLTGKSKFNIILDMINSTYKYNVGIMDYFQFRFFEKNEEERSKWVGTGYKYEFDLKTNPKETRSILENKLEFYEVYKDFIFHPFCKLEDIKNKNSEADAVLTNKTGKMVLKDSLGQCGYDVEIVKTSDYTLESLASYMSSKGYDMAESFIQQHDHINKISSTGLNTVRMFTVINNTGGVDLIGARLRVSVNSHVDNLASGNIACPVDLNTGKINGPGIYSDITKEDVTHHPVTNVQLIGFQIPMWHKVIELTKKIALAHPENRGVGWDIAITNDGIDFIEGNHNWCKTLWQLPVKKGMKDVLDKYN